MDYSRRDSQKVIFRPKDEAASEKKVETAAYFDNRLTLRLAGEQKKGRLPALVIPF